ncbi:hypothetical protein WR25_24143 [Diploscapter pachys]|uniref:Uncharacterized protein n=1 Tax=Diploscapter pachys TaxID=2018661 RepID=A0A2A2K1L7_9BILA|nr:hypothetical protein WR25_24143 [Diploscapter pachys]
MYGGYGRGYGGGMGYGRGMYGGGMGMTNPIAACLFQEKMPSFLLSLLLVLAIIAVATSYPYWGDPGATVVFIVHTMEAGVGENRLCHHSSKAFALEPTLPSIYASYENIVMPGSPAADSRRSASAQAAPPTSHFGYNLPPLHRSTQRFPSHYTTMPVLSEIPDHNNDIQ